MGVRKIVDDKCGSFSLIWLLFTSINHVSLYIFNFRPDGDGKSNSNLVIPMVVDNDWRLQRLLRLKSEGKLNEEEQAKLELLTESASSSLQKASSFSVYFGFV